MELPEKLFFPFCLPFIVAGSEIYEIEEVPEGERLVIAIPSNGLPEALNKGACFHNFSFSKGPGFYSLIFGCGKVEVTAYPGVRQKARMAAVKSAARGGGAAGGGGGAFNMSVGIF